LDELSEGECSITDETIAAEPSEPTAAILRRLLKLRKQLQNQSEAGTELQNREARLRALFDQAPIAIWDLDISGVLTKLSENVDDLEEYLSSIDNLRELLAHSKMNDVNRATLDLFGAESVEEFDRRVPELLNETSYSLFRVFFTNIAAGRTNVEVPGLIRTLRGDERHIVLAFVSPRTSAKDPGHSIVTVSDVTAQHRARDAAQELAVLRGQELERVNTEVQRLFHAASHDLRSPLRGVSIVAEWIGDDVRAGDMDQVFEHVDLIRNRVSRLEKMLEDLLAYARAGQAKHAVERIDVGTLLEEIERDWLDIPDGFHLEWDEMPILEAQRTLLAEVLYNLIANAIRHHDRDEGHVVVTHRLVDGMHQFSVADDGPGIPAEYRERIFAMFKTLKPRDEVEGSGIGLAFVTKVVVMHGGTVTVTDTPARGATFTFTWPARSRND
jgi:signal transduction histidine kinase